MQLLTFRFAEQTFGIEAKDVDEVISALKITKVWGTSNAIKGLTNLRGEVITIIDLAILLGQESAKTKEPKLIVLRTQDEKIALEVEEVCNTQVIEDKEIQAVPKNISERIAKLIKGVIPIGKELICLLNVSTVLNNELLLNVTHVKDR